MDCSQSSNRKPTRRAACSNGFRRRTCRGSRTVPGNVAELAAVDTIPEPPAFIQPEAASASELVPALTESVKKARSALGSFDDVRMGAMWRLQHAGKDILAMPRVAFVRAIMLNHWYHHRGQLLVYLRLLNQSVPSVYGPTADENPFAGLTRAAP
jgi:hypothetical protein